ncbi:MAG: glycosyltransferase family 9 protein [Candidatus Gastranaerophilales bacterium]|nr:glycosyltransferase family 9 protein [Candidatus Gastranaerophilales bacterium]
MYKNILVINLMYIGDLLFTTPLLRTLRNNFAKADITMLVDSKNADVVKYNPNLSEIIAIDKKGEHNKLFNYLKLINDIRKRKFDLVINLHPNERASVIAAFSGAKRLTGFSAKFFGIFFNDLLKNRRDIHQTDAYLEVLKAINITDFDNQGLEMYTDRETEIQVNKKWQEAFPSKPLQVIGINTGGSWKTKRWTREGFASLADSLLKEGYGVAFFGGTVDISDVQEITKIMEEKNHPNLAVFTGKITLTELACMMKKCSVVVSGDSGPMHIAVSQKVPVISIFGPSDPVRYSPYQQDRNNIVFLSQDCLACGKHECEDHICMRGITADKILTKIKAVLSSENSFLPG